MSDTIFIDEFKPYYNARVNNLKVDGKFTPTSGDLEVDGDLTVTGTIFNNSVGAGGIVLPNVGASSNTPLTYYEESPGAPQTFSGPWAAPQTANVSYVKIGKIVTMSISTINVTSTGAGAILMSAAVPIRFRPAQQFQISTPVINNSVLDPGVIQIDTSGSVVITRTTGAFAATGTAGWATSIQITYSQQA